MIFDRVWRLRWKRDWYQRKYDRWIHQAEKKKDYDKRELLTHEVMDERRLWNDEISSAETIKLQREAERLGLPVPPQADDAWEEGYNPSLRYLTVAGRQALRQAIRRERRDRWEFATVIVKDLAVPVIGVIATIVSLILALKVKHP